MRSLRALSVATSVLAGLACDPVHTIGAQAAGPSVQDGGPDGGNAPDGGEPTADGGQGGSACGSRSDCPCGTLCGSTSDQPNPTCLTPQGCTSSASDCQQPGGWTCLAESTGCGNLCVPDGGAGAAACATDLDCPCGSVCADSGAGPACFRMGPACAANPDCAALGAPCITLYRNGVACGAVCLATD